MKKHFRKTTLIKIKIKF